MKIKIEIFAIALSLFFTEGGIAQARFKATTFAGINFSQIDGDRQQGYRHVAGSLGLEGSIYIRPDFDISVQLMYNQKGAKPNPEDKNRQNITLNTFALDYSEVALLFNYHYGPSSLKTYYTQAIFAGVSYGRLLKSSASIVQNNQLLEPFSASLTKDFKTQDFSFIAGWTQHFTPRFGMSLRYTQNFSFLYRNPDYKALSSQIDFEYLRPYFISVHLFYNLVSPNKTMGLKSKKQIERSNPVEELY